MSPINNNNSKDIFAMAKWGWIETILNMSLQQCFCIPPKYGSGQEQLTHFSST